MMGVIVSTGECRLAGVASKLPRARLYNDGDGEVEDLDVMDGATMGLGFGSLPSAMLPSAVEMFGSRVNLSRASTHREAKGQTSLHSMRMAMVRWSIMGPSRLIDGSGQTMKRG